MPGTHNYNGVLVLNVNSNVIVNNIIHSIFLTFTFWNTLFKSIPVIPFPKYSFPVTIIPENLPMGITLTTYPRVDGWIRYFKLTKKDNQLNISCNDTKFEEAFQILNSYEIICAIYNIINAKNITSYEMNVLSNLFHHIVAATMLEGMSILILLSSLWTTKH